MGILNWRREALLLAVVGMETCWVVAWSRVLLRPQGTMAVGFSFWSVFTLFIVALTIARLVGSLGLERGTWIIAALAVITTLLLLEVSFTGSARALHHLSDPSAGLRVLTLLLGFFVWFRALRIPDYAGDTRGTTQHFQIGLFALVAGLLASLWFPAPMNELVLAFFGFGLLAVALSRIEEVARTEPGGAAPLNLKWTAALAATLLIVGVTTLLATQLITVETARWVLRPFIILINIVLFVVVIIATVLAMQILPLLQALFKNLPWDQIQENLRDLQETPPPSLQEEASNAAGLSPKIVQALQISLIVVLVAVAVWVIVRSFRRWRMRQYGTTEGVREMVTPDGTMAEDLAAYLRDQWRRLRGTDLRRLFRRVGTASARAIYVNLLALMAAADRPRQPEQTPYEYEPIAEEVLPMRRSEIEAITEAYVRARYGEMEISAEELAHLQEAWKRVQADAKDLL